MRLADTSVLVAGYAAWHERHDDARRRLEGGGSLVAHAALECYSVLTRLPGQERAEPDLVARWLSTNFRDDWLVLPAAEQRGLPTKLDAAGVSGGGVYDALIGLTSAWAGATLISLDRRALPTYRRCGVTVEWL